ncbi:acetoacetate decarboxylase [Pseudomonas asiatica]|uniref:Acetoacetate decarboxylase n=1 Tax=Pseudomonas asiatica TaxID=2219225 RepID=A0ABU5KSV8_9PSED|nr:acetoacetate decarboxylase [Pseudomonas asiatica]MDZ5737029.1 acetoacetate decarboxylase [Pseudomonas asiatica]MDZ5742293.1 acetoacetate decarboxylase [Pseudomonas asiatica]MDZ5747259.1 acetoacetate decarboxylase [Pseudomonas asiatica]MDZ5752375.1 acetoacetate decarboxylase [Pseudomonas asiatica]
MNCPVDFSRRQVLLTAGIGLVAASSPLLAQSLNGTQLSTRSSGGLYLPNSAAGTPWTPESVRQKAYAMPVVSPGYPQPPSWFLDRPSLTITYRTDIELARAMVPEPLMVKDPLVSLSFLWMVAPGIGDYYEFAQSIACFLGDEAVSFRPLMVAENVTAIMLGREVWGLPKKYGHPRVGQNNESYVGTLEYDGTLVARASMAYKYQEVDLAQAAAAMRTPGVVLKVIPDVDGKTARIAELVRFEYSTVELKEAWTGAASLELFDHEAVPIAALPVREIVSVRHTLGNFMLAPGKVVHDYLK